MKQFFHLGIGKAMIQQWLTGLQLHWLQSSQSKLSLHPNLWEPTVNPSPLQLVHEGEDLLVGVGLHQ